MVDDVLLDHFVAGQFAGGYEGHISVDGVVTKALSCEVFHRADCATRGRVWSTAAKSSGGSIRKTASSGLSEVLFRGLPQREGMLEGEGWHSIAGGGKPARNSCGPGALGVKSSLFCATRAQGEQRLNFESGIARRRISGSLDNTGGGRIL